MTEYKVSKNNLQKSIHGLIRHQGLPVAGIKIHLYAQQETESMSGQSPTDEPLATVTSGTKGDYEFNVPFGNYSIQAVPRSDSRLLKQSLFNIELNRAGITCDISLKPGLLLSGIVRTASGDPVKGGEVFALGIEPTPYWSSAPIDRRGRFTLVLPRGKFHIGSRCSATGIFGDPSYSLSAPSDDKLYYLSKQIHSIDLNRDQSFDLELPELVRFRGELNDPLGNPVAGARVLFTPKDVEESPALNELDFSASCMTDAKGRFEIHLEPGIFDMDVVPARESKQFGFSEADLRIDSNLDRKFTLEEGHKLSGRVLYKDSPMADCLVRIHSHENDREFIAESNQEGEFAASIPPGIYTLLVSTASDNRKGKVNQNHSDNENDMAPWTKEIVVGGDTHVAIKLKSGVNLSGCIKDDAGRPKAGIRVSVFSATKSNQDGLSEENLGRSMAHTNTGENGHFSFSLEKGKYWLVVHRDFESAKLIEMENDSKEVDVSWHGWCQVGFLVEGEDGSGIPRCKVSYEPYKVNGEGGSNNISPAGDQIAGQEHPSGYVITDRDGRCRLTIPSGIYSFRFNPPQAGSYADKEIRQLSIIADSKRKVLLGRKN